MWAIWSLSQLLNPAIVAKVAIGNMQMSEYECVTINSLLKVGGLMGLYFAHHGNRVKGWKNLELDPTF